MKNFKSVTIGKASIISVVAVGIILFSISSIEQKKKIITYKVQDSKVSFAGIGNKEPWIMIASPIQCEGSFEVNEHQLINLSGLSFQIPISKFKLNNPQIEEIIVELFKKSKCEKMVFVQKYGMVLPIMQKIHVVGELNVLNGIYTLPIQVSYDLDSDHTLRIKGKQSFLLKQFGIKIPAHLVNVIDEEVEFEIDILLQSEANEI